LSFKFKFLGTGTSVGVPQIGCDCSVCTSSDPRDKRRRCGAYVTSSKASFLIDTPVELRLACVEYGIKKVDSVLLTHAHMDHIAAFDDVRRFNTLNGKRIECDPTEKGANGRTYRIEGKPMKCYALPETIEQMHHIFPYISVKGGEGGLYRPQIEFEDCTNPFKLGEISIRSFRVEHGFPCCGYLLDSRLAYMSDCHSIPDEAIDILKGVDILVIDCLREREHPTHMNLERCIETVKKIAPKETLLTHMCHDLKHEDWLKILPKNIKPAYDGLELQF
jgi:phosphoribosyl 1,2-cyclic phosphate phosphodiesterase